MRKKFTKLIETICIISIAFIITISCGGGGGDGGGSTPTPTPTDNFGSIKSYGPIGESETDKEFWTKERIDEALKNPIIKEYKKLPNAEATPQISDGPQGSFPAFNPDIEKEKTIKYTESSKAEISCENSESCPSWSDDYKLYYTNNYESYPFRIMGALAVKTSKDTVGYCSASLINDKMILTAAHCVSKNSAWYSNFIFAPGLNNSSNWKPYGYFGASYIFVYSGWFDDEYYPADYAIIVLDQSIGNRLGWLGVYYNVPSSGKTFYQFGYKGGEKTLFMNVSDYGDADCDSGTPCRMLVGSPFVEGMSGGPWCLNNNNMLYANGVNSQGSSVCPIVVSPYFNDKIKDLYNVAKSYQ